MAYCDTVAVTKAKTPDSAALRMTSSAVDGTALAAFCIAPICSLPRADCRHSLHSRYVRASAYVHKHT